MDKVRFPHLRYSLAQDSEASPINYSMTVKDQLFRNHNSCSVSDQLVESWPNGHQNSADSVSIPGDLVSLAWLQKGDIIQIAPLDGEEEIHNGFENSTASLSSIKSDDFLTLRTNAMSEDSCDYSPFSMRSTTPARIAIPAVTSAIPLHRPASADHYPSQCNIDSPQLPTPSQLTLSSQGLSKPNYSYTHLIFMAIESTPQKCMTVNQIYNWCESNFPFYKHAGAGWKNSLRHNLSINKSFKRLPRDSRGPGRGAFWTVEPRERPALLDAIKRNPWNFSNMATLVSAQSEFGPRSSSSGTNLNTPNLFGLRRLGLTQSAPSHLLRTEGIGNHADIQVDTSGNLVNISNGSLHFLSTPDGRLIATCDDQSERDSSVVMSNASPSQEEGPARANLLPDSRYWLSSDRTNADVAGIHVEWSAEEEEKYMRTLRLLMESDDRFYQDSNTDRHADSHPCEFKRENTESVNEDVKLITKQRRKSRLQPTRIIEDPYPFSSDVSADMIGKCNECKENAASGCESCQAIRLRFLSDPLLNSSMKERALAEVANAIDSDQECGPAGGPAVRKPSSRTTKTCPGTVSSTSPKSLSDQTTNEVFVTPAPYIDHEYSHCQAQLRRPEENRIVNQFNEAYCAETVKRLMRSHHYSRRSSDLKLRRKAVESYDDDEDEIYYEDYDDDLSSSQDQAEYSDEYESPEKRHMGRALNTNNSGYFSTSRRRGRHRGANISQVSSAFPTSSVDSNGGSREEVRRRSSKVGSRGRRGRKRTRHLETAVGLSGNITRRSRRVIRAPRRPYDDFEESFSIDGGDTNEASADAEDENSEGSETDTMEGERPVSRRRTSDGLNNNSNSIGRRSRKRKQKRNIVQKSLLSNQYPNSDEEYGTENGESSCAGSDDEEARYLKMASRRQRTISDAEQEDVPCKQPSFLPRSQPKSQKIAKGAMDHSDEPCATYNASAYDGYERVRSLGMGAVWSQSRWSLARKFPAQLWSENADVATDQELEETNMDESVAPEEDVGRNHDEIDEDTRENDCAKTSERTTVEAAQILLGISQMQSFRRQSGYLSLDSSITSSSSAGEVTGATPTQCPDSPLQVDSKSSNKVSSFPPLIPVQSSPLPSAS
ncbi:unnamed protein product [Calicophoron daubneyi]|uniref:Fork-head domain-containing protein n=1 Tax=Calicophoron daubneyi TaxID=300641 RepID=A0AAV2TWC2_CALDB